MSEKALRIASFTASCACLLLAMQGQAVATAVPEIDPGSAISGLALALGAGLLLVERLRHR